MNTILLHKDVYMPKWIQSIVDFKLSKYKKFTLSKHVKDHAILDEDRSHGYTLAKLNEALTNALGKSFEAFEVELTQYDNEQKWIVSKICIRIPYSTTQEACISIRPYKDPNTGIRDTTNAFIVTAWLNSVKDEHFTLEASKYFDKDECEYLGLK